MAKGSRLNLGFSEGPGDLELQMEDLSLVYVGHKCLAFVGSSVHACVCEVYVYS